jgi:hypothetical protein
MKIVPEVAQLDIAVPIKEVAVRSQIAMNDVS